MFLIQQSAFQSTCARQLCLAFQAVQEHDKSSWLPQAMKLSSIRQNLFLLVKSFLSAQPAIEANLTWKHTWHHLFSKYPTFSVFQTFPLRTKAKIFVYL